MPAPRTRAVEPGSGAARFTAWMATERGSRSAAASKDMLSGSLLAMSQSPPTEMIECLGGQVVTSTWVGFKTHL